MALNVQMGDLHLTLSRTVATIRRLGCDLGRFSLVATHMSLALWYSEPTMLSLTELVSRDSLWSSESSG